MVFLKDQVSSFLRGYVRPFIPRITRQYNGGVRVRDYSLIDPVLGAESLLETDYKQNLVRAVRESVSPGDDVVVVGGGFGVTTVHAYLKSNGLPHVKHGRITCFEPSSKRFEKTKKTVELNSADVDLRREAVGDVKKKIGNVSEAGFRHPSNLPDCDVLELDCEGAELEILQEMKIRPQKIVVETHEEYGSPTEDVKKVLNESGYDVVEEWPDCPATNDNVLTAKRSGGGKG